MKESKHVKIAVRLDDITADMDWDKFYKFKAVLDKHQIKPLLGVVPDNQDKTIGFNPKKEDFFLYIKELGADGWTIAQHGYQHVYSNHKGGIFPLNKNSEFTGESYGVQSGKIQKGKEILQKQGIYSTIYMSPAHSYDYNTIRALLDLGFTHITDGFGKTLYRRRGMIFLPIAFHSKNTLKRKEGVTTLVFHTNTMNDDNIANWDKVFGQQEKHLINYQQLLNYPAENRRYLDNLKEHFMAICKYILVRILKI